MACVTTGSRLGEGVSLSFRADAVRDELKIHGLRIHIKTGRRANN